MQVVAGVAGLVGLMFPGCWCSPHRDTTPNGGMSAHDLACFKKHGFDPQPGSQGGPKTSTWTSSLIGGSDNCPQSGCGLNGSWLGRGFQFRELRNDGRCSKLGLHLGAFSLKNEPLFLQVVGDEVQGFTRKQQLLTGAQLKGAQLIVERYLPVVGRDGKETMSCDERVERKQPPDETYLMTFEDITTQTPWAECVGACPPAKPVTLYQFSVVNTADECNVELCKPGLSDDNSSGMKGTAVIFTGDAYDDKTYDVRDVSSAQDPDHAVFNVACLGTAVSKLHMFGHTAVASTKVTTTLDERQALLRLLTGDYCGAGKPFTVDGVPLRIDFANPKLKPRVSSGYEITSAPAATSVDARWKQDGATCVGAPRLSVVADPAKHVARNELMEAISTACATAGHALDVTNCALPANLVTDAQSTSANP